MKLRWIPMLLLLLLLSTVPARAAGALHTAYLAGYPDGTIRPEAPVTRAQLAVILFRLAEHVPEQADAETYKHWLVEIAESVVGAASTGGVLGIGGVLLQ